MNEQFVSDFVSSCLKSDITTPVGMIEKANEEIFSLEKEIECCSTTMQELKTKQNNFKLLVRQLGGEVKKAPVAQLLVPDLHQVNPEFKKLCMRICDLIEKSEAGLSPSEIRNSLGDSECYAAAKWLWDRKILARNEKDHGKITLLIKGLNWDTRFLIEK